jgi:hypothetical protein
VVAVHVTFLWPVIITEMVQVFSYIENQLLADTEEFRYIPYKRNINRINK